MKSSQTNGWLDQTNTDNLHKSTQQAALDVLVECAKLYSGRQTTETFKALERAIYIARTLKVHT